MERNNWKLATIAVALTGVTALSTGLTTAWMLRPAAEAQAESAPVAPTAARPAMPYAATVSAPPARVTPAVARPAITPAVVRTPTPAPATRVATEPADCTTGTDRAIRIAKPGAIGALIGAGLGAAGGAAVKGGSGAGKGALLGGIAGAALGTGYGAYKTQNECGTILGGSKLTAAPATHADEVQAMAPATPAGADRIEFLGPR